MKIIILMGLISITTLSCSKSNNGSQSDSPRSDVIVKEEIDAVIFEQVAIKTAILDGENKIPSTTLDFATLQTKQSAIQDLIITNGDSSSLIFGSSDIDSSDILPFVLIDSCSNKTLLRNRSCKLSFSIKNIPNQNEIVLTKSLTIKGTQIQLTATLAADPTDLTAPVSGILVAPTHLDFGLFKNGLVKELAIIVSNRTQVIQNIPTPILLNPKISLSSNTCSSLERNRSCTMKFSYSAASDETISQENFTSILNNEIKHSVLVQSPTESSPQILSINSLNTSSSLSLTEPQNQTNTIKFINSGTVELQSPVTISSNIPSGVTVNSISCSGGFSRNRTCSVSYSLNSALLPEGENSLELKLKSGTNISNPFIVNLTVIKLNLPCTIADAQSNGWNVSNHLLISGTKVNGDLSLCNVSECSENYSLNSQTKSCDIINCTMQNASTYGVNLSNVASVSGTAPNCVVAECSSLDYTQNSTSCIEKEIINASFSFVSEYSNSLTNSVSMSAVNAKKVLLYRQANCNGLAEEYDYPISLIISPIQVDGNINASVKFKNIDSLSECISDSYVYDTVASGILSTNDIDSSFKKILATQTISIDSSSSDLVSAKVMVTSSADCSSVDFSGSSIINLSQQFILTPIANVVSKVCAIGFDLAGNQTSVVNLGTMTTDLVSPSNIATFSHPNYFNSTTQTPVLTWTSSSDTLSGLNRYEISVGSSAGGIDLLPWTSIGLVNSIQLNVDLSSRSGLNAYPQIRAIDNAGNTSQIRISQGWYVGLPSIDLSIVSPTSSDRIRLSNVNAFEVRGYCSEVGRNVSIKLGTLTSQNAICSASNLYSRVFNASALADGNVLIEVTHDNSFLVSRTLSVTVVKDTVAPLVGFSSPVSGSSYAIPGNSSFSISGTCSEIGETVRITSTFGFSNNYACSASNTFQFSINLSSQNGSSINIFASQTDIAGNIASEVSLNLRNGNFTRLLTTPLNQTEKPIVNFSTFLGDSSTGKIIHQINARNDGESSLAISNIDGSEFNVLTPQVGNASVTLFNDQQGENNDRLGVYSLENDTIYFRQRIANTNASGVYAVSSDGSNYRLILGATSAHPDSEVLQLFIGGTQNDKLIFIMDKESNDDYDVYASDLDGNNIVKLSGALAAGGDISRVHLIPNSQRILYWGDQDADFKFDLYSVNIDGTSRIKMTPEPQAYVEGQDRRANIYYLTNNGQHVVYSYDYRADDAFALYSARTDGSTAPLNLSSVASTSDLYSSNRFSISPDQSRVAYVSDDIAEGGQGDGIYHVFTVNLDGTNRIRISPNFASSRDAFHVRWSNDSSVVYWIADAGTIDDKFQFYKANAQIIHSNVAASEYRVLSNFPTTGLDYLREVTPTFFVNQKDQQSSVFFRITPDGNRILFICDTRADNLINQEICSLSTSSINATSATVISSGVTNIESNIPLLIQSPSGDDRFVYLIDSTVNGIFDAYLANYDGTLNRKISAPIISSSGTITTNRDFLSVDWNDERIIYALNDISANKYAFSSSFSGTDHIKIGPQLVVSDVNTTQIINNRIVFQADANKANQGELFSVALNGTDLKKISVELGVNDSIFTNYRQVGNTDKIVYVISPSTTKGSEIHVVDVNTPASDILLNPGFQAQAEIVSWLISMDGQYVVFIADGTVDEVDELYAAKLDGTSGIIRLNPTGWTGTQDVSSFTIAPNSRTVAAVSDSRIDIKSEVYITNIDVPSWVNITSNIQSATTTIKNSTSLIAIAPVVFNSTSSIVLYAGDLFINGDVDLFSVDISGSPVMSNTSIGASETSTFRNVVTGFLITDPNFTKAIFRADIAVDNQIATYSMNFDGSALSKLTTENTNSLYTSTSNTSLFDTFDATGTKYIFRADFDISNKFELYSVNLDGTDQVKLNQALADYNDVHNYFIASNNVVYLADVGSIPRRVYSKNLTGGPIVNLSSFNLSSGQAFSYYRSDTGPKHWWGSSVTSQWIGINANGNSSDVVDCYITRVDGVGGIRKISPNLAPLSSGCNLVMISPNLDTVYFQADAESFGVMDVFLQSFQ